MANGNNEQAHSDHHRTGQPPRTPPRVLAGTGMFSSGTEQDGECPRQESNYRDNRLWTRADYEESDSEASQSNDGDDDNMDIAGQPPYTPCKP